jgi:hypothetical protein
MFASLRTLAVLVGFAGVVGCSPSTKCTVINHSAATLTNIVVSGSKFSAPVPVPELAPGHSRVVALSPVGEVGILSVAFRANGQEYSQSLSTYFEASGYEVRIDVSPEFHVTCEVGIWPHGAPTPGRESPKSAS